MNGEEVEMEALSPQRKEEEEEEDQAQPSSSSESEDEDKTSESESDDVVKETEGKSDDDDVVIESDDVPRLNRGGSLFGGMDDDVDNNFSRPDITIEFKHLSYSVRVARGFFKQLKKKHNPWAKYDKYLLKDLTASFQPNQVTAIMGPSGAGKTTLLNLLAGRIVGGKSEGEILVNGVKRKHISRAKWQRLVGYVMQDDVMQAQLSTREILTFVGWLRLRGAIFHPKNNRAHVEAVIKELGLTGCASTKIGAPDSRGISGGQRKRASIGIELMTEPSVLFLDEPTSGLDSTTAFHLVTTLKKLADLGRTIVTTIHQPSTDIFMKFDKVILLSMGHIIFSGPPQEVVPYFSKLNFKCPKYTNPAEFIMTISKTDSHIASKEEGIQRVYDLITAYRTSNGQEPWDFDIEDAANVKLLKPASGDKRPLYRRASTLTSFKKRSDSEHDAEKATEHDARKVFIEQVKPQKRAPMILQLPVLVARESLNLIRNPIVTWARLMQTVLLSLMVGLIYLRIGHGQSSIQDREGALFFVVTNQSFGSIMSTIAVFPADRVVYIREHASGAYGTLAYYLAKTIADLPYGIFFPALTALIMYWMVGFDNEADKFFTFLAALIVLSMTAQSFGMMVGAGIASVQVGMALTPIIFIPLMLFGGFFLNTGNIPDWLSWIQWISLFKYGFEIVMINEFTGLKFTCSASEAKNGACPVADTGEQVLHNLNMDNSHNKIWINFLLLLALFLLFKVLGYFMLRWTAGRKRGA